MGNAIAMPFRQVHLDFHTSPQIEGIGADFDAGAFVSTLRAAHVDSITVFAKCHHGMAYYDTQEGVRHPQLSFDLLGDMVKACHDAGIRIPIYFSLGWDEHAADAHPEWLLRTADGAASRKPLDPGWRLLCFNTPYADYVEAMVGEIVERYPVDGMFFDIVFLAPCYCSRCLADMKREGLDPASPGDQHRFRVATNRRLMGRLNGLVRGRHPNATVYYNSLPNFAMRPFIEFQSHLEIECLPRGGWGYDFFPFCVRRMTGYDKPMLGMTGRFLENWGHFGSLSPRASLEYECFSALAHGAGCSIGDQLHPRGRLDRAVYELIGEVYEQVERREAFVRGARVLAEAAIVSTIAPGAGYHGFAEGDLGAMRMLLENQVQFEVLDTESDFTPFRLLVLPDGLACDDALANKLNAYTAGGGRLLATARSGLDPARTGFVLDALPIDYVREAEFEPEYIVAGKVLAERVGDMPLVAYERGLVVRAREGAQVRAHVGRPYFNRTWEHFCSHFHTPYRETTEHPAIVRSEQAAYFAHPLFTSYYRHGFTAYRELVLAEADRLLGPRLVRGDLPRAARVTLLRQEKRFVLVVLYYVPEKRTARFEMVEDVVPLRDVALTVRLPASPRRVYTAPDGEDLPFKAARGEVSFTLPEVRGCAMVVFD